MSNNPNRYDLTILKLFTHFNNFTNFYKILASMLINFLKVIFSIVILFLSQLLSSTWFYNFTIFIFPE